MRRIARPLLAAVFISGGIDSLRNPKPPMQAAEPMLDKAREQVGDKVPDQVPTDTETLVKLDAAIKVGAGIALALNKFPRLAALLLAGTLVPTTAAAHRFWEHEDPQERSAQQIHFFKNLGLLGGLMIAAGDTHGKPSIAWRTKHAANRATGKVQGAAGQVQSAAGKATGKVQGAAGKATGKVQDAASTVQGKVRALTPG